MYICMHTNTHIHTLDYIFQETYYSLAPTETTLVKTEITATTNP